MDIDLLYFFLDSLNNGMLRMLTETTHRDIVWRKSKCTNHQTILVYIDAIVIEVYQKVVYNKNVVS